MPRSSGGIDEKRFHLTKWVIDPFPVCDVAPHLFDNLKVVINDVRNVVIWSKSVHF